MDGMDSVWEKLAYGDTSPCDDVSLKSIKHNLGQILTCVKLRANLSITQMGKIMCYLAMHGEFDTIEQLVKEGFVAESKVFANAIRYGHAHKFVEPPKYAVRSSHFPYEIWGDVVKGYYTKSPELMAARFGYGELLEKLRPNAINVCLVSAAICGGHDELAETLAKRLFNPWKNQSIIFAAYCTRNKKFIDKAINPDMNMITIKLFEVGLLENSALQAAGYKLIMRGKFRLLLEKREFDPDDVRRMYCCAVSTNNLKVLKWLKFQNMAFSSIDDSRYEQNFSSDPTASMGQCRNAYQLVVFAAIFANFKVFKWLAQRLRRHQGAWTLFSGSFPNEGWFRNDDDRISFDKYEYLFEIGAIEYDQIFLRAIERGNLIQLKKYANKYVRITSRIMSKCRDPQKVQWLLVENYNISIPIEFELPLEIIVLYHKHEKMTLQAIERNVYQFEKIDILKWLISVEHKFSEPILSGHISKFQNYAFVEFLFENVDFKVLTISGNLPLWIARILTRFPLLTCVCVC